MSVGTAEKMETKFIEAFEDDIRRGVINPNIVDLSTSKQKTPYQQYINKIIRLNPKEYFTDSMPEFKEDFFKIASYLVIQIFGQEYFNEFRELILNKLYVNQSKVLFDGVSIQVSDAENNYKRLENAIEIPDFTHLSSIVCLLHEFTHYICQKHNLTFNKKMYYEEILSIYVEKRAIELLNQILHVQPFTSKIEETRLEGIKWHYTEHKAELDILYKTIEQLHRDAKTNMFARLNIELMKRDIPQVESLDRFKRFIQFYENRSAGYGLGYLYSESLLSHHLDDPTTAHKKLQQVLSTDISLEELLRYYNISTDNRQVYDTVDRKLELIKRH